MSPVNPFYTLMASLPFLPPFDQVERLPISALRLRERLRMLDPKDQVIVEVTHNFLRWQRHPLERTDRDMIHHYANMMAAVTNPALRAMVTFRVNLRTLMTALRRRYLGRPAPRPEELWGVGEWVGIIARHWQEPYFHLDHLFPAVKDLKQRMDRAETYELEHVLLSLIWENVSQLVTFNTFNLQALLAYLFKWDIIERWLSYQAGPAQERFKLLVEEAIGGQAFV